MLPSGEGSVLRLARGDPSALCSVSGTRITLLAGTPPYGLKCWLSSAAWVETEEVQTCATGVRVQALQSMVVPTPEPLLKAYHAPQFKVLTAKQAEAELRAKASPDDADASGS